MRKSKPRTLLGKGYNYDTKKEGDIYLDDSDRKRHMWTFGTTGVGKTRMMENIVGQDIRKGYNVFIIDPKIDGEFFSKVAQVAKDTGRLDDLMLFSPVFPQYSCAINPLEHFYMKEEIVAHVLSGVEVGREPFFFNVANESTTIIVRALIYMLKHNQEDRRLNFEDIKNMISHKDLTDLYNELLDIKKAESNRLGLDLLKILDSGQDYYNKISSSLRVTLMELTTGNTGQIIGNVRGNTVIERIENGKGVIFVAQVGSLLTNRAASTTSRVLVSMLKSLAGRIYASGQKLAPPLALHVDEAQNVLFHGFEDLVAKVGSANFMFCGYSQSINQIYATLGDMHKGKSILDNINTKLFMRVTDKDTANYAAEHFGTRKRLSAVLNISGPPTMRETEEPLVKPQHILSLQNREFYMLTYDGRYLGKTAHVEPGKIKIKYPKAGD